MELRPTNVGTGQPLNRGETGDSSGCQGRYVNLIMEKAREKDYAVQASYFFLYFCLSNDFDHGCRASKSRENIQGPCLAVPSGKPIGLRIFMLCHQGNPSGSSRFLTPVGESTRSKEFLLILPRACAKVSLAHLRGDLCHQPKNSM